MDPRKLRHLPVARFIPSRVSFGRDERPLVRARGERRPAHRRDHRREPAPDGGQGGGGRGARRPPPGLPGELSGALEADGARRARPARAGRGERRPRRHLVAQPLRVGRRPVRDRPHRRDPGQHQSRLPVRRAGVRPRSSRAHACSCSRARSGHRLRRDARGGAPALPRPRAVARARGGLGGAPRRGGRGSGSATLRARGRPPVRRPDQHPVHVGDDRLAQGRDALPPQHPQQRLLHRGGPALHGARPRLHPRALLPLLRDGAGQPGLHDPRRLHRRARRGLRPRGRAGDGPGRAVHVALRRADHVHRRAGPPAVRRVRPLVPPHGDHGRLPLPDRGDEEGAVGACTCTRSRSATA